MNKITLGLILGAVLGALDGATSWFTPEVRAQLLGIIVGSTFKGIIAGVAAGWFAKKVQNLAAGILFGLVVGAFLAYGIVMMNQGKYFWAIMLPGSCVGAICGWATQQYGAATRSRGAAAVAALFLLAGLNAHAAAPAKSVTAADAYARLKGLSGTWKGSGNSGETKLEGITFVYRVSAAGNVVEETLFAGTPHEMITMYTIDGGTLVATHYCGAGNQPSMKLNLEKSTADDLVFDFINVRGEHAHDAPHIQLGAIRLKGSDSLEAEWGTVMPDGKDGDKKVFVLTRAK